MTAGKPFFLAWWPEGVSVDDMIAAMAGIAMLFGLLAVYQTSRLDTSLDRRLAALSHRRRELQESEGAVRGRRRRTPLPSKKLMRRILHQLNLLRSREAAEGKLLLARAGLRSPDAMDLFLFSRLSLPCIFGAVMALDAFDLPLVPIAAPFQFPAIIAAIVAGMFLPTMYLKNLAARRAGDLRKGLPDGLDLLVICVEAGLTLDAALARVARELGQSWPALADEFGLAAIEMTFLPERRQALENLGQRTDLPDLRGVINTLQQAERYGTPLANSLRVLSAEFRETRMMRAEEKAARLPSLLTLPMMVFILPVLFIVLLGPALLTALVTLSH
jgi:tight adherence protein C